ncbi:hypothetical protein HispidOSU_013808, partial [Sigmodon hispidus]
PGKEGMTTLGLVGNLWGLLRLRQLGRVSTSPGPPAGPARRMRGKRPSAPRANEYAWSPRPWRADEGIAEAPACESLWPDSQNSAAAGKPHVFVFKPRWFK